MAKKSEMFEQPKTEEKPKPECDFCGQPPMEGQRLCAECLRQWQETMK